MPATADVTEPEIIKATRHWVEHSVIGLNLCPFARAPFVRDRVRLQVSHACDENALLDELADSLKHLLASDILTCETTLLIHPWVLNDFFEFNLFLRRADGLIRQMGLEGEIQLASFHPDYQFADAELDAVENCSNRSPYPILHLLRESSISKAADALADPDEIYRHNIETLRALGMSGWQALQKPE